MINKASFIFTFKGSEESKLIAKAISPEIHHKIPKTFVTLSFSKNILTLTIKSDEISTLRASCNSYLRWINTAIKVNELV